ncbi:hypothetical protein [uncultured Algoriphagus sp.]|uniref:hypothetical protein n=1 Tax=uncultured Algoriphagus sp. TaxID=417365 RepID=UPI0030ED216A|tara:strand:- start:21564 stop:21965 length:402 start_codon:yes stop_codon:yes gene_type:complete
MVADNVARQFLLTYKHIIRISVIEDDLGITGKSIYKWIIGKKPLPDKWIEPLYKYLYPMLDKDSELHQKLFQVDRVIVLDHSQILPEFQGIQKENLNLSHFSTLLTKNADVIYFRSIHRNHINSHLTIYSKYF